MNRKILTVSLVFCILMSLFSVVASGAEVASGTCGASMNWSLSSDGTLTISGTGAMTNYSAFSDLPWASVSSSIVKVVVENGVTSIGNLAFYQSAELTAITIGKDVAVIGDSAFSTCPKLQTITVNSSNASFKSTDNVIYSKDGKTLVCCPDGKTGSFSVPSGVVTIGDFAFEYCIYLTKITIPSSVTTIGEDAFSTCVKLSNIEIGSGVSSIGKGAFSYCSSLKAISVSSSNASYKSVDGVIYSKDGKNLVLFPAGKSGEYAIPSGVQTIENYGFYKCTLLTGVVIPDTVVTVGEYSFSNCEALANLTMGKGLKTISKEAFSYCKSLVSVTTGSALETIGDYGFYHCDGLKYLTVTDSVKEIGKYAFARCGKLRSVDLGKGVQKIEKYSFSICPYLKSITIPSSVTSIGFKAFGFVIDGKTNLYVGVEGFTVYGDKGSQAEQYATKNSFAFVEGAAIPEPAPDITTLPENDYYIDKTNNTMPNIVAKTSVSTLVSKLSECGITATVAKADGTALADSAVVGTGCTVNTADGGKYTVIVCGDVDGTGKVDSTDYLTIKKVFLGGVTLDGAYFSAADANGDGNINSTDYLRIKSYFLGNIDLYA